NAELVLNALQRELRPLSKRDLLSLVPEYSQRSIERALLELQNKQQIEKIGRGRATRYRLV
ncbi:MAG TPA: cell filamentation protein Fic, partial [Lactobacillus sp.]|nr:cell filamentation protein Fic [Lactobacillus sp.]